MTATTRERAVVDARAAVKRLLDGLFAQLPDPAARAILDTTMKCVLDLPRMKKDAWDEWLMRYATKCFTQFIPGITMFASRDAGLPVGRPPYHRPTSCGEGMAASAATNMRCDPSLSEEENARRRRTVFTCYVERSMYDSIFQQLLGHPQNVGHLYHNHDHVCGAVPRKFGRLCRPNVLRKLFESCFAANNLYVVVDVEIDPTLWVPQSANIRFITPSVTVSEVYTHAPVVETLYGLDVPVNATRTVSSPAGGPADVYSRVQSYYQEPDTWLPVSPGRVPLAGGSACRRRSSGLRWCPFWTFVDPWLGQVPKTTRTSAATQRNTPNSKNNGTPHGDHFAA
jgi:hypothetical protein